MLKLILQLISECCGLEKKENRRIPAIIRYPLFYAMMFLVMTFMFYSFSYGFKVFKENNIMGLVSILAGLAILILTISVFYLAFKKIPTEEKKINGRDFQIIEKGTPIPEDVVVEKSSSGMIGKVGIRLLFISLISIVLIALLTYL